MTETPIPTLSIKAIPLTLDQIISGTRCFKTLELPLDFVPEIGNHLLITAHQLGDYEENRSRKARCVITAVDVLTNVGYAVIGFHLLEYRQSTGEWIAYAQTSMPELQARYTTEQRRFSDDASKMFVTLRHQLEQSDRRLDSLRADLGQQIAHLNTSLSEASNKLTAAEKAGQSFRVENEDLKELRDFFRKVIEIAGYNGHVCDRTEGRYASYLTWIRELVVARNKLAGADKTLEAFKNEIDRLRAFTPPPSELTLQAATEKLNQVLNGAPMANWFVLPCTVGDVSGFMDALMNLRLRLLADQPRGSADDKTIDHMSEMLAHALGMGPPADSWGVPESQVKAMQKYLDLVNRVRDKLAHFDKVGYAFRELARQGLIPT